MRFSLGHAFEFILTWNLWDLLWWFNCSDSSFSVKHYELLEALSEIIFDRIFQNEKIKKIKLKIEKLDIVKEAKSVGIEVIKTKL